MQRHTASLGFALFFFVAACQRDRVDVSTVIKGVPALSELKGLMLPAPLYEVERNRPRAVRAAYVGLQERIGDSEVWFVAPELALSSERVPSNVTVTGVDVERRPPTDSAASIDWADLLSQISEHTGQKPTCARSVTRGPQFRLARWRAPKALIHLRQGYADSARNGGKWEPVSPRIAVDLSVFPAEDTSERSAMFTIPSGC